eukprot:GFKZ01004043.1.p1 GENE.GFKZ01004043.1~~GFKZ01004043.1.p1  ORF type:complete len:539 (+),score=43.44 GFKZ01004043.1:508-2124(+)
MASSTDPTPPQTAFPDSPESADLGSGLPKSAPEIASLPWYRRLRYPLPLPVDENGKSKVISLISVARPHMRAFHFAWLSFFLAFFGWFALSPLQAEIRDSPLTPWLNGGNFRNQNIIAVAGTILMRLAVGPFCDRFGPRLAQSSLLSIFSIPVFLVGTSGSYAQWTTARFFIGFVGATFVVTQFWTSIMFSGNIVGTANATSAGWGNLGGGVTNAIMPLIANGIRNAIGFDPNGPCHSSGRPLVGPDDNKRCVSLSQLRAQDRAWRFSMIIPGTALLLTSVAMWFLSDDLPEGNYASLIREGKREKTNPFKSMGRAASNWRVWVLFFLYSGNFGIELIMNLNLATYFQDAFGLEKSKAGVIAGVFGLMNLFARSLGGIASDLAAKRFGLRGRLWAFFFIQAFEGTMLVIFSRIRILAAAIPVLIGFSLFVQMAEGATFGIVPFVDPPATGAISGIVGAGGNFGAVAGGFLIDSKEPLGEGIRRGFFRLGFIVIGTAFLLPLLYWPHYGGMFCPARTTVKEVDAEENVAEEENPAGVSA